MLSMLLNIGSLLLGLIGWAMPLAAMAGRKSPVHFCAASFGACCLSLLLQLVELRRRCVIGDLAAVEDTIGAITLAAVVLLIVAAALNALAFLLDRRR